MWIGQTLKRAEITENTCLKLTKTGQKLISYHNKPSCVTAFDQ
jgi:hypothetical protein